MVAPLIAIVEDDEAVLGMIAECLESVGYRTLPHRRGAGAYELIARERPDAVARLIAPPPDDPASTLGGARARGIAGPVIRTVVGLVDTDGKGITAHTAQLEQKGYKVVACRWGDGIFDMVVREQPDVLLVDPGDRSRGAVSYALRRVGRDPLTGHIPIVTDPPQGGEFYRRIEAIVGTGAATPEREPPRR